MDEPLEEVGDVEGSCRVLNFVESDGLSRVRVCHVGFTPFISNRPRESSRRGEGRHGELGREANGVGLFGRDNEKGASYWQTWVD